jgi:predicted PurR-regulated permease PerM
MHPTTTTDFISQSLKWVLLIFFGSLILSYGKVFFTPLLFGLLIAMIMYPACKKMEEKGISRTLSITIILLFVTLLMGGIIWLLEVQVSLFLDKLPLISNRLEGSSENAMLWFADVFGISATDQTVFFQQFSDNPENSVAKIITSVFSATLATLVLLLLTPIFSALFLYHRGTFVRFLESVVSPEHHVKLHLIVNESILSYFKFAKGTFYVYCIVGVLNSIGLLLLGIENAIVYGLIAALMTIIPYVGIFISAAIPVSIAYLTKDSMWYPIGVIAIFTIVQYLEANVIYPKVVGAQLNLSTWATLVGIVLGTIIWGLAGMILITPLLAILKIVSDYIPEWKPINLLLNRAEGYQQK